MLDVRFYHSLIPIFADKEPNGKEITSVSMCQNQAAHFQMAFKINDKSAFDTAFYIRVDSDLPVSMYYINNVPVMHTSTLENGASIGLYPDVLFEKSINPPVENRAFPWHSFMAEQGEDVILRAFLYNFSTKIKVFNISSCYNHSIESRRCQYGVLCTDKQNKRI